MIKDAKVWALTDESYKVVAKSFRGATTSQMKWHLKPSTEQNSEKSFYIAVLMIETMTQIRKILPKKLPNWPNNNKRL